jgi:HK97 family phage prohead protease
MTPTDLAQRARLAAAPAPKAPCKRALPDPPPAGSRARHKQVAAVEADAGPAGGFTAKVSDFLLDRTGERFAATAFDDAVAALRAAGRPVPVLLGHDSKTVGAVLGAVEADGWRVAPDGLYASGWVDTTDAIGAKVRSMLRRGVLSWSIGFIDDRRHREKDGTVIDHVTALLELSVTPTPANGNTETFTMKADENPEPPSHTELESRLAREGHIVRVVPPLERDELPELHSAYRRRRNGHEAEHEHKAAMLKLLTEGSSKVVHAHTTTKASPITIARFPC